MNSAAERAIIDSSSVRMTRTATRASSAEMSGAPAALRRSSRAMPRNSSPVADAAAGLGRVLADAAGEDEDIEAAECRGQRPDALSSPGSRTARRPRPPGRRRSCRASRSRRSGLVSETPSRPDSWLTSVVELVDRHPLGPHQEPGEPGVDVAGARAHDQPRGRRQAHGGVDATAVADRREARPGAEVGQDDAAAGRSRPGDPGRAPPSGRRTTGRESRSGGPRRPRTAAESA